MLASLRADTRGLTSGQTLTASKTLWGGLVGAHAAWTPVARVPVALQIAGGVGGVMPIARELVVDGYTVRAWHSSQAVATGNSVAALTCW